MHPLVIGSPKDVNDKRRQIFNKQIHFAMDNHFSGGDVERLIGEMGWSATMTCRRDCLPKSIDKKHLHYKKVVDINQRSKAARYKQPIIAVKKVIPTDLGKKSYNLCHVSFQSTGSTNISTVNSLSKVGLYVRQREKGRGASKRIWAIEMNEARETYLKTYSAVDKIDQMLKDWYLHYCTWRWWHAPTRHGKAIAKSMAYSIYLQCAEGKVDPDWKLANPMSGPAFRQQMSRQMCEYRAVNLQYPGNEKMRASTQTNRRKRRCRDDTLELCDDERFRVSYNHYLDKKLPRGLKSRLCSDNLTLLKEHLHSFEKAGKGICQVCGKKECYTRCKLCNLHACYKSGTTMTTLSCSIDLHDDYYFGLTLDDRVHLFGEIKSKFKKATASEIKKNAAHIKKLRKKFMDDMENDD